MIGQMDPRLHRLFEPHMVSLTHLVGELVGLSRGAVPHFDPNDGGTDASIVFVLQRPGPKAVMSGFISRENPDLSARYMGQLLAEAGIPRNASLLWNVVPWYAPRQVAIPPAEIADGAGYLQRVLNLLPNVRAIVFVGRKAQAAKPLVSVASGIATFDAPHPSPSNLHTTPTARDEILASFSNVARAVGLRN